MADSQFAMFAVHSRKHQATVTFQANRVLVRMDNMLVSIRNPKPATGRRRWNPCRKHVGLLVKLAHKTITQHRIEQEERDLSRMKDRGFA